MTIRAKVLAGLVASTLSLGAGMALAQDSTPDASPEASPMASPVAEAAVERIPLSTPDGVVIAYVDITQDTSGDVTFLIDSTTNSTLEPGLHGIHIHEVGSCDASGVTPYESAGDHFNPTDDTHGGPDDEDAHAGDLGNLEVTEDGFSYEITTDRVSLDPADEHTLAGPDGTSLIVHAGEDDLETDPSGESGDRVACGILFPSTEPAMNATPPTAEEPAASPEATPAS